MKFGRKPAVHNLRTMRSALALAPHLDALGPAPANSNDYVAAVVAKATYEGTWGMLGNDTVGCCVIADDGHYEMLRTANSGTIAQPTTAEILAQYSAETGYDPSQTQPDGTNPTDNGTDETGDCQYMISTGLLGHKSQATAMVNPSNLDHVKWTMQIFGRCRMGISVTQKMMDQFNAGEPWSDTDTTAAAEDHDVPLVLYTGQTLYVVTWGRLQLVTEACFRALCCFEAHAEAFPDWITSQGTAPSGLDMEHLISDLQAVT
jgi:hypothetical protein